MTSLRFFFLSLIIFASVDSATAKRSVRGKIHELHQELKSRNKDIFKKNKFENRSLGQSSSSAIRKFQRLNLKTSLDAIAAKKPDFMTFTVPSENGTLLDLEVMQVKAPSTKIILSDGKKLGPTSEIAYYRGAIRDQADSLVTLTIQGNTISGAVATDAGENLEINTQGTDHILYNIKDTTQKPEAFKCETAESDEMQNSVQDLLNTSGTEAPQALVAYTTVPVNKKVRWYYETDYDLFVNKGSAANVTNYIQSAFNQVATLYANDGIVVELKTLFVWTTVDPYTGPDNLGQFGSYRTSWDGDLAFLVGLGNSGVAYVNGVSRCNYSSAQVISQKGYAGISSTFKNAPDYSWTVEALTHEMGHQLGSSHTHACQWNGNNTKIDSCGDSAGYSEGSCGTNPGLPSAGGTIMSYCHLTSAGVNLANGFGVQPQALIAGKINNSVCLMPVSTVTPPPAPTADTTAPTVALTNPTTTSTLSGSAVSLAASASDNISVSKVKFYVDNILVGSDTTTPYNWSWNSTAASNGLHTFLTKAFDSAGNVGTSPTVSAQVTNSTATTPVAPTNLAGSVSGGKVTLSWSDLSTNETGFEIEMAPRPLSGSPVYQVIASVGANVRTYVDTLLSNGTYYYRVRAKNTSGYSAYSIVLSKTLIVLAAPSYLTGTVSGRQVKLKWYDRSTNESGFVIEMAVYGSSTYSTIATVPLNATSYSDTRTSAGTYKYRVKAINANGSSSYTSVIQKTVY
jgi:hypothetical protein